MTDQLIAVSLYSFVLAYPAYRNTKLLLKGNQSFSLYDSRAYSDNCLLIRTDHGSKQETFLQMQERSPSRFFVSVLYFVVVDCRVVSENGIDKPENRDEREANFKSGKPRADCVTADNRPSKRYGNSNSSKYKRTIGFTSLYSSLVNSQSPRVLNFRRSIETFIRFLSAEKQLKVYVTDPV